MPIFTQKCASVDMNWGFNPQHPAAIPTLRHVLSAFGASFVSSPYSQLEPPGISATTLTTNNNLCQPGAALLWHNRRTFWRHTTMSTCV